MNDPNKQSKSSCNKKAYQEPNLRVYGDILKITQSMGTASKSADKPGGGTNKTK